jgi:hypothetical protein
LPRWSVAVGRAVAAVALLGTVATTIGAVAPKWLRFDSQAMTADQDASHRAAEQWVLAHVGHDKRLLVDDTFWIFLIEHGFNGTPEKGGFFSRTVVFYWPLDYDPAVQRHFPDGWRDFDYVISSQGMRNDTSQTPNAAQALLHSRPVATFGTGAQLIEIRQILRPPTPPTGRIAAPAVHA